MGREQAQHVQVLLSLVLLASAPTALGKQARLAQGPAQHSRGSSHGQAAAAAARHSDGTAAECLRFLKRYAPPQDAALPNAFLVENTQLALEARAATPWARAVPWDLFLNYVLPYANVDERRDSWRGFLRAEVAPLVADASSLAEAALAVNARLWRRFGLVFVPDQTPAIMSPFQVLLAGHASCTGFSIFLVDALRAVGVPARVTGVYEWETAEGESGNHCWVEAWDGAHWSFLGASEPDPRGFNHTWFYPEPAQSAVRGSRKHAIYATSWAPTPGNVTFPLQWHDNYTAVNAYDVTDSYKGGRMGGRTALRPLRGAVSAE